MTILAVARDQLTDLRHRRAVLAITIAAVLLAIGAVIQYIILKKLMGGGFTPPRGRASGRRTPFLSVFGPEGTAQDARRRLDFRVAITTLKE